MLIVGLRLCTQVARILDCLVVMSLEDPTVKIF